MLATNNAVLLNVNVILREEGNFDVVRHIKEI